MTTKAKKLQIGKTKKTGQSKPADNNTKNATARKGSKLDRVLSLLCSKEGATLAQLTKATGWQPHSVRGVMSGSIKKKLGLTIQSEKHEGVRTYKIQQSAGN